MTTERTHEQQQEHDAQQHRQTMEAESAARTHELNLIEYNREVDLERVRGANLLTQSNSDFDHESKRSWRLGRLRLIFLLVGIWLAMAVITLAFALVVTKIADNLALFISLIAIVGGVAVPASAILYAQGYSEAQSQDD